MKRLADIRKKEASIKKKMEALDKKKKALDRQLQTFRKGYDCVCKKCGIALKKDECGIRRWEVGNTLQDSQPMGDYDVWQTIHKEERYCCPKCGADFKEVVPYSTIHIAASDKCGRWDDKRPDLFTGWHYEDPEPDYTVKSKKGATFVFRKPIKGKCR